MDDVLPVELRAVFRLALRSRFEIETAQETPERPPIPIVKELIESILFSRRFIPSYLAVLAVAIIVYGTLARVAGYLNAIRAQDHAQTEPQSSTASSSSSTLRGTDSPPSKSSDIVESSPLLLKWDEASTKRSFAVRAWHTRRSWLLYQPKPIPSLTATRNTLPANKTSITILTFLALNLFYMFYHLPLSRKMVFAVADRAGLLFVANLPVLYILAAKNNQPLQWLTNWSYEGLNIFHRRLGEWMTIAAVVHAAGMVIAFYDLIAPAGFTLWWYLTRKIIIFGSIAFVSYMCIYLTSIGLMREFLYELFLASHIILQVAALVMLFLHHHDARPYVGAAVAVWLVDRAVTRLVCKTKAFVATLEIAADGETVLVHTQVKLTGSRLPGLHNGWCAGQHVFLTIPSLGTKYRFQGHPFTIASPAPPKASEQIQWPLQLTIRAQAGFSKDLLEYAKLHQHVKILLDGPYSSPEVLTAVESSDRVCLIAGGSGIAVTYPLAWARMIASNQSSMWTRPFYHDGLRVKPVLNMTTSLPEKDNFAHFWIRQEARNNDWICMVPCTAASMDSVTNKPTNAIDLVTHRFETRSHGQHHRPDIQGELEAWIRGDAKPMQNMNQRICVVVSGPEGLIRDVQNAVAAMNRQGFTSLKVHVEAFGW